MKTPKALTLDLDDTLWPVAPTIRRAEARANDWFRTHAPEVLQQFDVARRLALREALLAEHPQRAHDLGWMRQRQLERMLDESGHDPLRAVEVYDIFMAARQEVVLYPDALAALAKLAARFPIAAVSNGNADIKHIGLDAFFSFSLSASDYGAAKPDQGIYLEACRRLGFAPDEVLHVGDDPLTDVIGAQRAGLLTAWVNRGDIEWAHAPERPTLIAGDLAALADLLVQP
jgi:2-haloalkanoic acid dehalogenase type II